MAIILEEIYEVALHRYNMKLVAGGRGLRNLVDWVHTVEEMDYVSFLKGRELIVTTGFREAVWLLILENTSPEYRGALLHTVKKQDSLSLHYRGKSIS